LASKEGTIRKGVVVSVCVYVYLGGRMKKYDFFENPVLELMITSDSRKDGKNMGKH
jgi:hypothetical protein